MPQKVFNLCYLHPSFERFMTVSFTRCLRTVEGPVDKAIVQNVTSISVGNGQDPGKGPQQLNL